MTVTKLFAALGVVALLSGIVAGLIPASTTVEASLLPDVPVVDVVLRLGGSFGISVEPGTESFRVDCGSAFAPSRFELHDTDVVQSALGVAERVETSIETSCDAALDSRAAIAVGALGVGGGLLVISAALAALKATSRVAGLAWKSATRAGPVAPIALDLPSELAADPLGSPEPTAPNTAVRTVVAVGALIAVIAIGGLALGSRKQDTVEVAGTVEARVDPDEQTCVRRAINQSNTAIDEAFTLSAEDQAGATLNLDGDSSFVTAAEQLGRVALSLCPPEFQASFARWTDAWIAFGEFADEASKPHAPWNDEWSESSIERRQCAHGATISRISSELSGHLAAVDLSARFSTMATC